MGQLRQSDARSTLELHPTCAVGRGPRSDLRLDDPRVSTLHALIRWEGTLWSLRDLDSRNGTFLDGQRLASGETVLVSRGARLGFGAPEGGWLLVDDGPPAARATCGETTRLGRGGVLVLPVDDAPLALIVLRPEGWMVEREGETGPVRDGEGLEVGAQSWTLSLPEVLPPTVDGGARLRCGGLTLRFQVSADEEHVALNADHDWGTLDLGARAHHYLLLTLARARLKDRAQGHAPAEEGWQDLERLAQRLGMSANAFYVQTCRARAQLAEAGVEDAAALLERRAGGRIRLGVGALVVERG